MYAQGRFMFSDNDNDNGNGGSWLSQTAVLNKGRPAGDRGTGGPIPLPDGNGTSDAT
jgi:hypothetical protein